MILKSFLEHLIQKKAGTEEQKTEGKNRKPNSKWCLSPTTAKMALYMNGLNTLKTGKDNQNE